MFQTFNFNCEYNNECRDITEKDFRFKNSWKLYVFDVHYQNRCSAPHLVKVTLRVTVEIEESSYAGFAIALKYYKKSIRSDGQSHLSLIQFLI